MANEEILRLRTTVMTDEGLAKIRAFGNEFAQVPKKVGAPLKDLNTIFGTLSGTIKKSFVDRRNPDAAIYLTTDEGSSPEIQLEEGQRCIEWTCSRPR